MVNKNKLEQKRINFIKCLCERKEGNAGKRGVINLNLLGQMLRIIKLSLFFVFKSQF